MKKTRNIHHLYKTWQKLPIEIRNHSYFPRPCIVGKWHYHYKNKNGEIGLVRFNHSLAYEENGFHYEACGTLDFERFETLSQAENAIYKKLGEIKKNNQIIHQNQNTFVIK